MKEQRKLDSHYRRIRHSLRQTLVCCCLALLLLFIEGNNFGYEGAKEFGLALQKNKTLTTLNLGIQLFKLLLLFIGNNNIGDEGAKELGVTLQKNKTLTTLNLGMALFEILLRFIGGNDFGYEVAKEFGFALQKNKTLTTLNLGIPLVWHYYYSSQGGIILEMKEQRKLAWRCKKMRHQPRQISVYLLN
eukprot:TRINITY_DN1601_c0_g1_i7.p1 TRINITY_DN1601_c0_g1~~TRINITY_DN1601_c0_g1_i7.p1  ORF type:complete len:189 (+),score=3.32 TRINITY_DN1601_c0_g1_i7:195-761(+)